MNISFPIFDLPVATKQVRASVRAFIDSELSQGLWRRQGDFSSHYDADFSARLGERGWLGVTWPKQYGGHELTTLDRLVITEELIAANAPMAAHWVADRQSGPLLIRYGNEAQRQEFLPGMAAGKIFFSIGMSEPDSGSDLASVRTKAVKVAGGWQITGRKIWTTYAHKNHYAIVLARTGEAGKSRHEGLSQFIVNLHAKDLEVKPVINMAGRREFNEMVFDDSFVSDDGLVGEVGNGWQQVTSELAYERSGPERYLTCIRTAEALIQAAGDHSTARIRETIGRMTAKLIALRAMSVAVATQIHNGAMPNLEAALIKDLGNAFEREQIELIRSVVYDVDRSDPELLDALAEASLYSPSWSLRGGTREILRGVIARGLGIR